MPISSDPLTESVFEAVESMRQMRAEIEQLKADADLALSEAARLLESFVVEHCSPIPEWKPLPDLIGVLSQLSNAITIARDYKAEIERLRAACITESNEKYLITAASLDRLREIERLRAALREIIDFYEAGISGYATEMRDIARAALEGK
jgi:hypothetical protein